MRIGLRAIVPYFRGGNIKASAGKKYKYVADNSIGINVIADILIMDNVIVIMNDVNDARRP